MRVEVNLKYPKLYTLILLIGCLISIVFIGIQRADIINAAKVDGEILCTYVVTGKDSESYSKSVALMSVTYFYNGKRYISDVGITTQLGKPTGKKITVYVNKKDPNIIYNPAMINWTIFAVFFTGIGAISYLGLLIKTIVKKHSDKEIREMLSQYDEIDITKPQQ